jgi:hypothetical protein
VQILGDISQTLTAIRENYDDSDEWITFQNSRSNLERSSAIGIDRQCDDISEDSSSNYQQKIRPLSALYAEMAGASSTSVSTRAAFTTGYKKRKRQKLIMIASLVIICGLRIATFCVPREVPSKISDASVSMLR